MLLRHVIHKSTVPGRMRSVHLLLLAFLVEVLAADLDIVILHNNDMHARFEETSRNSGTCKRRTPPGGAPPTPKSCVGGFARTAHVVRKYRKQAEDGGKPVLYLNAGDTYVGTAWFAVHKWNITADFLNALGPDVASLGNHEFDFGVESLAPLVQRINFPLVAANLDFAHEPSLQAIKKSVILNVKDHKIGVVGHLTPDTKLMSSPGAVLFSDVVESVKRETEELDRAGVKIIIVLGHSGYDTDLRLAREVPLADVVIGGHTNTFLWNGAQPDIEEPEDLYPKVVEQPGGKRVPVVQAYAYTKYLGRLNVTFDGNGELKRFDGQPIFLDTNVPQDADLLDRLEVYRPAVDALDKEIVGRSSVLLDASNNKCRKTECNFGNMITDALVYYMANQYVGPGWTDTPIGLMNGGSIRTTIDPSIRGGNITRGELMGSIPFENRIISCSLSGSDLLKTLEIGARSNGETSKGEFLQVSGLHVSYDFNKPSMSRVVSVKVRCGNCSVPIYESIQSDKIYNIVTISFLTNGGDDHQILKGAHNKKVQDLGDVDTIIWYLSKQSPVYAEEQGRIQLGPDESNGSSAQKMSVFNPLIFFLVGITSAVQYSIVL